MNAATDSAAPEPRGPMEKWGFWIAIVITLGGWLALRDHATRGPGVRTPDVIVCLVDALRADRLSSYGNPRKTSPEIDALAARGALFERAYAAAPWTLASVASIFTATLPTTHGAGVWSAERNDIAPTALASATPTLAASLRKLGYSTRARTANSYLTLGCLQGFDRLQVLPGSAEDIVDWALEEAEQEPERPMFLYLHFMDVHTENDLPTPFVHRFPTPEAGPRRREHINYGTAVTQELCGDSLRDFVSHKTAIYDGALSYLDEQIGRLVRNLPSARRGRPATIVITADHGEELWDHAELERSAYSDPRGYYGVGHGQSLFEELIHVPLVVAGTGVAPGTRVKTPVSLLDVAPTLVDVAGGGALVGPLTQGRSLLSALSGREPERIPLFAEQILYGHERRSILDTDDSKLIEALDPRERSLLFDLASDPKETKDQLSEAPGPRLEALRARLRAHFDGLPKAGSLEATPVDAATADALRHIGYMGKAVPPSGDSPPASAPAENR
jgi:arylsulfatase A-like enzyme